MKLSDDWQVMLDSFVEGFRGGLWFSALMLGLVLAFAAVLAIVAFACWLYSLAT